jgi:hypothetical protein
MSLGVAVHPVRQIVTTGVQGPRGAQGPPGPAGGAAFELVAGVTLSALVVVWEDHAGRAWPLDASDDEHIHLFAGVTLTAAAGGAKVTVQHSGPLDASGLNLLPGPVWLGADGALTQVPPLAGFSFYLGSALSSSRLMLDPSLPIFLE